MSSASPTPDSGSALDGRQIFFLFIGSALAACLIFAIGVFVGRRIEQRALAREKAPPADPVAVLDELANAEEALTFQRTVLERPTGSAGSATDPQLAPTPPAKPARYTLRSTPFAQRAAADDIVRRLRTAGYQPTVVELVPIGKPKEYRLQLGDFASIDGAQPLRGELTRKLGLVTNVVKLAPSGQTD